MNVDAKIDTVAVQDTVTVAPWDGMSSTYPSVRVRMDFRYKESVGTFPYHCHILDHEGRWHDGEDRSGSGELARGVPVRRSRTANTRYVATGKTIADRFGYSSPVE